VKGKNLNDEQIIEKNLFPVPLTIKEEKKHFMILEAKLHPARFPETAYKPPPPHPGE